MRFGLPGLLLFALFLAAAGCWNPVANAPSATKSCFYGNPSACSADEICAYVTADQSQCVKRHAGSTPFVRFPFAPDHPVVCTQGVRVKHGSAVPATHSFATNQFALDLESPAGAKNGLVYSAIEGSAMVSENPDSEWGLHVRVISPGGVMVLYAHLGEITVQEGQPIHVGDLIGREGSSGRAGHRHLHFSVHYTKVQDWLSTLSYFRGHPDEVPTSIPFETQYCDPSMPSVCGRVRNRMENVPCFPGSKVQLRADWRP